MTNETPNDPRKQFAPRILPWLLGAAALLVYWFTLNRSFSLLTLPVIAKVSGWTWQPEIYGPLMFLVTRPFSWLPQAAIPHALNIFSAVCAALSLGLLARSVALLPQDRTEAQRKREDSVFAFLTTWTAWLPPILAVGICGLQLMFWKHATNFTGEMFYLLLFAFAVWSVLEYRLDEREGRLYLAALVYGAAMADNWAMLGFLPIFIAALIWSRGLSFFNIQFLSRLILCGLAGLLLIFLLPLLLVISGQFPVSFWQALEPNLLLEWQSVVVFFEMPGVRHNIGLMSLTSLLPVLVLAIRWKSSFGDSSRIGSAMASFMFHIVHAVILGACIWAAFDPPFSPHNLGYGYPCLTFSYLGALGIGYFSGYFLLVFGKKAAADKQKRRSAQLEFLNPLIVAGVFAAAAVSIAGLIYKNTPAIENVNSDPLQKYTSMVEQNLPRAGGILLTDSDDPRADQPWRMYAVQAALTRDGRAKDFLLLDTKALQWPGYHRFLHRKFPQKWPQIVSDKDVGIVNPHGLLAMLNLLSKTNEIYYLNPSFGYYFEQFYPEQHGAIFKLKPLPEDTLLPPSPDKNLIAQNEAFWARAENELFPQIEKAIAPVPTVAARADTVVGHLMQRLHMTQEQNPEAALVGNYCSSDLNFWGVQLQKANELEKAAANFETAQKLNPDNVVAQINLQFNQNLRAGRKVPVDLSTTTSDRFGKFSNWMEVTGANGPFDDPSFCFQSGLIFIQNTFLRQAVAAFDRVRELEPDYLPARLMLAQLYVINHLPDPALNVLQEPLTQPAKFSLDNQNSTGVNILAAGAYLQKNDFTNGTRLIQLEISRHPGDAALLDAAARAFMLHGLYSDALSVINRKLQTAPDDPTWLYGKGLASLQLKDYGDAIAAFSRVLEIQTNNYDALFNRAVARLQSDKLDAARADYFQLQQTFTNSFQVAYGLGEIAWQKHDNTEAARNYKIYLSNANTNTAEAKTVLDRLNSLQH